MSFLEANAYGDWARESDIHGSDGPHFGDVLTFVNQALFESLEAGNDQHPVGAASVKELYGSGDDIIGHAVMVKVTDDTWYWYEDANGRVFADGNSVGLCEGCHSSGTDFVLTPFPLQ